jgi:hypothetical protein
MLELSRTVGRASKKQGRPHWPNCFLPSVHNQGGVAAAKRVLNTPGPQGGFGRMGGLGMYQYSVEASPLEPRFCPLFSSPELADVGFRPEDE